MTNKYISIAIQVILYLWTALITLSLTFVIVSTTTQLFTLGMIAVGVIVGYPLYRGAKYFWKKGEAAT